MSWKYCFLWSGLGFWPIQLVLSFAYDNFSPGEFIFLMAVYLLGVVLVKWVNGDAQTNRTHT